MKLFEKAVTKGYQIKNQEILGSEDWENDDVYTELIHLQKWLRKQDIFVWVEHGANKTHDVMIGWHPANQFKGIKSYELALSKGVGYGLNFIK